MRTFLLLLALALSAPVLVGQTYFAPIGTKWYNFRYQFGPWPPSPPIAETTVLDTATVQGLPCIVVSGGADCGLIPLTYVHQNGGRVWFTTNVSSPFVPLYDFDAGVGQTFRTCTPFGGNCAVYRVTAIETAVVAGQTFQIQHIELDSGYLAFGNRIIQYVGSNLFLFPQTGVCDPELGSLSCFDNGSFGYPFFPCLVGTTLANASPARLHLFPNPATEHLTVELGEQLRPGGQVVLRDWTGRAVGRWPAQSPRHEIQRNGLPSGLYWVELQDMGAVVAVGKVVFGGG